MRAFILCLLLLIAGNFNQKTLACGNEYFSQTILPVQNDSLILYSLLNAPSDVKMPYWSFGFGNNIEEERQKFIDTLQILLKSKLQFSVTLYQRMTPEFKRQQYKLLSDYAWYELRVGNKTVAVKLLEDLYALYPNEYNIVANLGTAYEVIGKNERALELLRKAVDINAKSHFNSEWIHIKILEQKLSSPAHYAQIINLGTKDFQSWINDHDYKFSQNPDSLKKEIAYQLHERLSFSNKLDAISAQLILDFADIVAKHDGFAQANQFYDFAARYDDQNFKNLITQRKAALSNTTTEIKTTFRWASLIWIIPLILFVLIFVAWIRSGRKQSVQD